MDRAGVKLNTVCAIDIDDGPLAPRGQPPATSFDLRFASRRPDSIRVEDVAADLVRGAAFLVVAVPPGTNASSVRRHLADQFGPETFVVHVDTRPESLEDLLACVLHGLGLLSRMAAANALDRAALLDVLDRFLISITPLNARVILIVDHADQLPQVVVDGIVAIAETSTGGRPRLQVVFLQPASRRLHEQSHRSRMVPSVEGSASAVEVFPAEGLTRVERPAAVEQWSAAKRQRPPRAKTVLRRLHTWWPYLATAATPAVVIATGTLLWSRTISVPAGNDLQRIERRIPAPAEPTTDLMPKVLAIRAPDDAATPGTSASAPVEKRVSSERAVSLPASEDIGRRGASLEALMRRAEGLARQPDVRGLTELRETLAHRGAGASDPTEKDGIESALAVLDRQLDEARRLQLRIDGGQLAQQGTR